MTAGRVIPVKIEYECRALTWILSEPEPLARTAPVVFALPGSRQTGQMLRSATNYRFEELADRDGFLLVYAEAWAEGGASGPEWNECRKNTLP